MSKKRLLMFYEDKCNPCVVMEPLVDRLEKELDVKIDKLEVWYNEGNRELLTEYAGLPTVPFFYNEETRKNISGESDYEALKTWAVPE